jgi:hypothetical protein
MVFRHNSATATMLTNKIKEEVSLRSLPGQRRFLTLYDRSRLLFVALTWFGLYDFLKILLAQ